MRLAARPSGKLQTRQSFGDQAGDKRMTGRAGMLALAKVDVAAAGTHRLVDRGERVDCAEPHDYRQAEVARPG